MDQPNAQSVRLELSAQWSVPRKKAPACGAHRAAGVPRLVPRPQIPAMHAQWELGEVHLASVILHSALHAAQEPTALLLGRSHPGCVSRVKRGHGVASARPIHPQSARLAWLVAGVTPEVCHR